MPKNQPSSAERAPQLGALALIAPPLQGFAVDIGEISPWPDELNPNRGDVDAVAKSLERFGQVGLIRVQASSGRIIAGNTTWRAARKLGWPQIAAVRLDVDDETAQAYVVADNRTADVGGEDTAALLDALRLIQATDTGLRGVGYDDDGLAALERELADLEGRTAREVRFTAVDQDAEAKHTCPRCGHEWR